MLIEIGAHLLTCISGHIRESQGAFLYLGYLTIRPVALAGYGSNGMGYCPVALEGEGSDCFSITQLVGQKRQ